MSNKKIAVLYHSNCPDGFSAAWAAWKSLKRKADYIPVEHQTPPPKGLEDKTIYMLDFVYPPELTKKIAKKNKEIIVIDHHKSAYEAIQKLKKSESPNIQTVGKNNKSGAVLAWEYFHPKTKIPAIIKYVQDGDLWQFKLPKAREILTALDLASHDFSKWTKFANQLEKPTARKKIIEKGGAIVQYNARVIARLSARAKDTKIRGKKARVVNSPIFASEIGNELVKKKQTDVGIIWFEDNKKIKVSLRSRGDVDVSKIAEYYNGGGHKAAASFRLKKGSRLPWK